MHGTAALLVCYTYAIVHMHCSSLRSNSVATNFIIYRTKQKFKQWHVHGQFIESFKAVIEGNNNTGILQSW